MAELIRALTYLRSAGVFTAMIYLQEAHADDVWPLGYGVRSHASLEDRLAACKAFLSRHKDLEESLQAVAVDVMDDAFLHAYGAWPERYFLAELSGVVAWASVVSNDAALSNSTVNALDGVCALSR